MFEEDTSPRARAALEPKPGLSKAFGIVLALVLAALAVGGFYWVRQQNQALTQQLADLQQKSDAQAGEIRGLSSKLHVSSAELERLSSVAGDVQHRVSQTAAQLASTQRQTATLAQQQEQTVSDLATVKQDTGSKLGAINGQISGVKGDVNTNQKAIASTQAELEATKAQLKSTIGDLGVQSGLIATTRGELDALEKSGARAYYEFKLTKSKTPTRVGAVSLLLKKVDPKHERYTLEVYADDAKVEKKDKTLNEPVQFLVGSNHALNELVVYQMDKNTVTGYVSAPKYPGTQAPTGGGN